MARAKKETALTPEERLQAVLVPDWEWPYKLPKNWCWTNWGECGEFVAGSGFKNEYQGFTNYDIPFYKVSSLKTANETGYLCDNTNTVDETLRKKLKAALIPANSLLFAKIGEAIRLNRRAINTVPCCIDNNMMAFVPQICQLKYAFYWSKGIDLYDFTNATTVPAIRKTDLEKIPFPLAPFAEQQRIVDRIESLFSKLDEAKEKAQAVVDSFETRKAAILHKAFTGELTAKWREEHDVGMESWHLRTIGEVCENVKVGIVIKPSQYYVPQNEGTPAFRSANVRECRIDDFNWVYLNEKGMKDNSRSIVHTGDVLVVRSGNPGTACVVPERFDGYNAIDILIAVPNKKIIISDYLCYYTNSPLGKKTVEIGKRGIALTHFNVKGFSQMSINIPTIPEQVVIVRTLGDLFAQEQQAKEAAEAVLDQIDLMKKSILARAFRGELGTNDPSEESAVELLR